MGAINGQGYIARKTSSGQNARLVRFVNSSYVSIHDILLVDSPTFHVVFDGVSNLHAFQITIRGLDIGGTDGIDLDCTDNCYLHHIQVTNRDECISVKSPSQNVLIEDMFYNHSGGMYIGSLTADGMSPVSSTKLSG
jgi:rhamnogalacturonan hydrolase